MNAQVHYHGDADNAARLIELDIGEGSPTFKTLIGFGESDN